MFQLDDRFLEDVGLGSMPDDQKKQFLQHIYNELELRVGTKLSEGLTDEQLEEFESIIDRKDNIIIAWLNKNVPDYKNDKIFIQLMDAVKLDADNSNLRAEYSATKWLEINRPDYKQIVALTLDGIKREVINNRDAILSK